MVNKMRLQFICFVALLCDVGAATVQPAMPVMLKRRDFLQWINMILWPTTTTTTTTATTALTTTTTAVSAAIPVITTTPPSSAPIDRDCSSCRCGLINTQHKIVGGQETRRHRYPWMAVLLILDRFYCAGSLINDLYVLTAAHCVEGVPPELFNVQFLQHNRSESDSLLLQRKVARVTVHQLYNPRSFNNDIALIRLNEPVSIDGLLRPICMPTYSSSFEGETAIVTGWGALGEGGYATDILQEVDVIILSQTECRNSSYTAVSITDNMICAGYLAEGAKDACSGDSGGPLQVLFDEDTGQYQLVGIVSWGTGCGRPNSPGVYTRVNQYLRWIVDNTPAACACTPYPEEDYF